MNSALQRYLEFSQQHWRNDFIPPHMMLNSGWASYEDFELRRLCESLPDQATLQSFRRNNTILMAGPSYSMDMLDIITRFQSDSRFGGSVGIGNPAWYLEDTEKFARQDKIDGLCWFAFSRTPIAGTLSKNWQSQQLLVKEPKRIPNAAEIMWAMTTSLIIDDVRLFGDFFVRSSSVDSEQQPVIFGTDSDGRIIIDTNYEVADPILGVVTVEKFPA